MKITAHKNRTINLSPPSIIALGFLALILVGSILLILPVSHHGDVTWFQAVFTATSAVTITGLSVVNVGEAYTVFGKIVIISPAMWRTRLYDLCHSGCHESGA